MADSDKEATAIAAFLGGKLKKDSGDETAAKRVLARILRRGPVPRGVRYVLASMIDPDMRDSVDHQFELKKVRRRGRPKLNDRRVAAVVWDRIESGWPKEAAYQHAVDTLHVSYSTAEKAFARHRKHFKGLKDWMPESPFFKEFTRTTE